MTWVVTLQIVDCDSPGTNLGGAIINDGYTLFSADNNGQFIAIVDSRYTSYIIAISKTGYDTRQFALSNTMNGTTQNICLHPSETSSGGSTNGGSGGW